MPIEIRELIIRTTVEPNDPSQIGSGGQLSGDLKQQLLQEFVDQMIDILDREADR